MLGLYWSLPKQSRASEARKNESVDYTTYAVHGSRFAVRSLQAIASRLQTNVWAVLEATNQRLEPRVRRLDTYSKAKRDINYDSTVGDFLCDICEFYRRMMNYNEVEYTRVIDEKKKLD